MHWKITALWRGKKVGLRETQRAVTPFSRLAVFVEFFAADRLLRGSAAIRSPSSPKAIDTVKTFTAFLLSVVAGAQCFAHASLLRADAALGALSTFGAHG